MIEGAGTGAMIRTELLFGVRNQNGINFNILAMRGLCDFIKFQQTQLLL